MFTEKMAVALLVRKAEELGRTPKKNDLDNADIARIKSKLGPWPRALEAAGLKEKTKSVGKTNGAR